MKNLRSIGGIDDDLIERAAPKEKAKRSLAFSPRRGLAVAACLVIVSAAALPQLFKGVKSGGQSAADYGAPFESAPMAESAGEPSAAMDSNASVQSSRNGAGAAEFTAIEDLRGLPSANHTLSGISNGASKRMAFQTLESIAAFADAFTLISNVRDIALDGENAQRATVEIYEIIGGTIKKRAQQGNFAIVRQNLIGGCTMDEPNNLIRAGGVYILPLKYNEAVGAYEVVGDLDALFEINSEGKLMSHSRFEDLKKFDGSSLPEFLHQVREIYPKSVEEQEVIYAD